MLKKKFYKTKQECEVTFEVETDAQQVELVCEANGWEPIAMKRSKCGPFRAKVRLPQEREFQFRYLVDRSSWINDEGADALRRNEFGSQNSIVSTAPAS